MSKFDYELVYKISTLGKKELRKYLIKHSKKIKKEVNSVVDRNGSSLLHLTITRGFVSVTQVLLNLGADVNKVDNGGCSPLTLAIHLNMPDMVELLLKYKPDFYKGWTRDEFFACFYQTSDLYKRRIIKSIIKHGFKIHPRKENFNSEILMTCIRLGFMDMAIFITKSRKHKLLRDILVWSKFLKLHSRPYTKLQNKILNRLTSILNLLHIREPQFYTNRNYHVPKILCSDGINNFPFISALINNTHFYDFKHNHDSTIQSIILNCYDANEPFCDSYQRNLLHNICSYCLIRLDSQEFEVLKVLLEMNFDINAVDSDGKAPLDYVYEGYFRENNNLKEQFEILIVLFHTHVQKLLIANLYVSEKNLRVIDTLYRCISKRRDSKRFIRSISIEIERMTEELSRIRKYRVGDFSLYDLFSIDITNFYRIQNHEVVKNLFQETNYIPKRFRYYGRLLQNKFEELCIRSGLVPTATTVLHETLMYRLPEEVVRQIVLTLTNNELFKLLYVDP